VGGEAGHPRVATRRANSAKARRALVSPSVPVGTSGAPGVFLHGNRLGRRRGAVSARPLSFTNRRITRALAVRWWWCSVIGVGLGGIGESRGRRAPRRLLGDRSPIFGEWRTVVACTASSSTASARRSSPESSRFGGGSYRCACACPTGESRAGGGLGLSLVCGSVAWRAVPFAALMLASGWVKRLRSRSSSRRLAKKVKDRCRCVCVCVRDAWRPVRWGSVAGRRGRPRLWIVSKVTDEAGCRALPRPVVAPVRWRCLHYRWGARTNCTRRGHYGPRLLPA
jgi:hypothetical protein